MTSFIDTSETDENYASQICKFLKDIEYDYVVAYIQSKDNSSGDDYIWCFPKKAKYGHRYHIDIPTRPLEEGLIKQIEKKDLTNEQLKFIRGSTEEILVVYELTEKGKKELVESDWQARFHENPILEFQKSLISKHPNFYRPSY